jgi:hypothetical protein
LAGADPALVQDALFDAEEHLQAEMATADGAPVFPSETAEERFARVVEQYGTPGEVAAAYLGIPATRVAVGSAAATGLLPAVVPAAMTPQAGTALPAPGGVGGAGSWAEVAPVQEESAWTRFFGVVAQAQTYKSLLYMLLALGTGIAYFTIVVTGLSLSLGLMILVIGLPLLALFLGVVRGISFLEGRLVELLLDTRMPRRPRAERRDMNLLQRMWFWVKDGRTWMAMLYMLLQLPLGIAYFTIAVTGLATGLGAVALPFVQLATGHTWVNYGVDGSNEFMLAAWAMPLVFLAGCLFVVVWLHLIRLIGRGHAAYAKAMLVRLAR